MKLRYRNLEFLLHQHRKLPLSNHFYDSTYEDKSIVKNLHQHLYKGPMKTKS